MCVGPGAELFVWAPGAKHILLKDNFICIIYFSPQDHLIFWEINKQNKHFITEGKKTCFSSLKLTLHVACGGPGAAAPLAPW